ncbi:hypothetical protein CB1_000931092 [Camelus ferus]|nr:hypothetical protein CB1_000931092 [Camelus ferus]
MPLLSSPALTSLQRWTLAHHSPFFQSAPLDVALTLSSADSHPVFLKPFLGVLSSPLLPVPSECPPVPSTLLRVYSTFPPGNPSPVILLSDVPLLTEDFYQVLLGEFAFRRVFCAVFYVTEQTALEVLVKVCELDIIFNFEKAYFILDEFIMGGEIQETSKKSAVKAIEDSDMLQEVNNGRIHEQAYVLTTYQLEDSKRCML